MGDTIYTGGSTGTYTPGAGIKSTSADGFNKAGEAIKAAKGALDKFTSLTDMTEVQMIEYNLAASKFSTMVSMASGLVKNLSDTEKQVANKM